MSEPVLTAKPMQPQQQQDLAPNSGNAGAANKGTAAAKDRALNMFRILMGNCFCEPLMPFDFAAASTQFVELHGILFIGLGSMMDELSPKERVYDTLEQLRSRTERMVSIGYLVEDDEATLSTADTDIRKITQTVPLDVWNKTYPKDQNISRPVKKIVDLLKVSWVCLFSLSHDYRVHVMNMPVLCALLLLTQLLLPISGFL